MALIIAMMIIVLENTGMKGGVMITIGIDTIAMMVIIIAMDMTVVANTTETTGVVITTYHLLGTIVETILPMGPGITVRADDGRMKSGTGRHDDTMLTIYLVVKIVEENGTEATIRAAAEKKMLDVTAVTVPDHRIVAHNIFIIP